MGFLDEEILRRIEGERSQCCCFLCSCRAISPVGDYFSLVRSSVKEVLNPRSPLSLDWRLVQLNVEAIEWMREAGTPETIPDKLKEFRVEYQEEIDRFYEEYMNTMKPTHPKGDVESRIIETHHLHAKELLDQSLPYINDHLAKRASLVYVETEDDKHQLDLIRQLLSAFSRFFT